MASLETAPVEHIGIPLEEQRAEFEAKMLKLEIVYPGATAETAETAFGQAMKSAEYGLEEIKNAPDLSTLLNTLIIRNVNEFKLKPNPNEADFLDILADNTRYNKSYTTHFVGPKEAEMIAQWGAQIEEREEAAKAKFAELSEKK